MFIKCWGSRGSIPVSGREVLKYGGDTTCLEIRAASGDLIIVDAGTGIRRLGNQLAEEKQYNFNFIFTHAHWDHIMGFPFFKPLYHRKSIFNMHQCPYHNKFVESILSKVMAYPHFPVMYNDVKARMQYEKACPYTFEIGSVTVTPFPLSHPNGGSGYKFVENGKSFVFLTDNELGFIHPGGRSYKDYMRFSAGADLLIHDAEYTPKEYKTFIEWGHSSYTDALQLAEEAGVKELGLFHTNQDRTDDAMDEIVDICQKHISQNNLAFKCSAVGSDMTFEL